MNRQMRYSGLNSMSRCLRSTAMIKKLDALSLLLHPDVHNRICVCDKAQIHEQTGLLNCRHFCIQVIATDKQPMQLHYVEHLDQVWVLCWNGEEDDSTKTIVVVRDASKYVQHRAVHTQPVGNHFDQVRLITTVTR